MVWLCFWCVCMCVFILRFSDAAARSRSCGESEGCWGYGTFPLTQTKIHIHTRGFSLNCGLKSGMSPLQKTMKEKFIFWQRVKNFQSPVFEFAVIITVFKWHKTQPLLKQNRDQSVELEAKLSHLCNKIIQLITHIYYIHTNAHIFSR